MLILNKLLPYFVLPFGVSLILLIWGIARRRRLVSVAGLLVLLVSSNPFLGHYLIRSAEAWAERRIPGEVPPGHAIVVLSSGRVVAPGPGRASEWLDADRFFGGIELFQAGKAPLLVFTGAWHTWLPDAPLEGDVLAAHARSLGVPAEHIVVTGKVSNTADEAREVAQLLRDRQIPNPRVVLVTSAFHMSRARQQFERTGLTVEPYPVDFRFSEGSRLTVLDFLPSLGAMHQTNTALREFYGRAFYWLQARF